MRNEIWLPVVLLALVGCYAPPPGPSYAQPGYPPPGNAPPGYPPGGPGYGYAPPGYPPPGGYDAYGNVYPGYSEVGGDPTLIVEGAAVPLILFGGAWGYWDSRHNWHRAPDAVSRHLEERRASRGEFRPDGPGRPDGGRPDGGRPEGGRPEGGRPPVAVAPTGGQTFFHTNDAPRPAASGGQAAGGFFHANEQLRPAAAPRPAAPEREDRPARSRDCPPGQHC